MAKFKKVEDAEQTPSFVNKAFFEDTQKIERDPYAGLKAEANSFQTRIATQTMDVRENTANSPWTQAAQDWATKDQINYYNDEQANNFNPLANGNSVRRSSFAADNGLNARDTDNTFLMTEDQAIDMQVSGRGYSIWHPFYNDMQALARTAAVNEGMFETRSREEIREERNTAWEREHLEALNRQVRPRTVMSSRSYVQRPNYSSTATNSFGFMTPEDYATLGAKEQLKQKQEVEAKFASKQLKRADMTQNERRETWERSQAAATYQDANAPWVDDILGSFGR